MLTTLPPAGSDTRAVISDAAVLMRPDFISQIFFSIPDILTPIPPIFLVIKLVFSFIAAILLAVKSIFGSVGLILQPIQPATVVPAVIHILSFIPDIFPLIPEILLFIPG